MIRPSLENETRKTIRQDEGEKVEAGKQGLEKDFFEVQTYRADTENRKVETVISAVYKTGLPCTIPSLTVTSHDYINCLLFKGSVL